MCWVAHCHGVSASNGSRAGQHLVGHHAERVDVAARIERFAGELLGAHVGRRAEHHALLSELLLLLRVRRFAPSRDAEVEHLDEVCLPRAIGEDDVLGLQVAMDDALLVRLVERSAHLLHDLERALRRHRSAAFDDLVQGLALDELHRDVERAVRGRAKVVELDGVWMLELRDRPALAVKAGEHRGVLGQMGVQAS